MFICCLKSHYVYFDCVYRKKLNNKLTNSFINVIIMKTMDTDQFKNFLSLWMCSKKS